MKPLLSKVDRKMLKFASNLPFQWLIRQAFKQRGYSIVNHPYYFTPEDSQFLERATTHKTICTNWLFRDYESFNSQHANLKQLFSFSVAIQTQASDLINLARTQGDTVVGVHLRRGDYAQWMGGKYLYSDSVYTAIISHLISLLPEKKLSFFLCSNEPINSNEYKSWPVLISQSAFTVDLQALSQCDLLLGPPSTFSSWASFIGQVPCYHIQEADALPTLDDFVITKG